MPEENIDFVRRFHRRYGELTPADLPEWVTEFWDVASDYYPARRFPGARPCHGHEEIVRFHSEFLEAWDRLEFVTGDSIAIGDDRVFVHATIHGEGRESGLELGGDLYQCIWLRHGHAFRWEDHMTLKGALRALGLKGDTLEAAGLLE